VSEVSVIVLKALHLIVRMFLVLAGALWVLISLEILPPLFVTGEEGLRSKLVHIWSLGEHAVPLTCQDSLHLLHEGYTDLFLFLLLTWAAVEVKRFLYRRIVMMARRPECEH
jgi:hypothetical protein